MAPHASLDVRVFVFTFVLSARDRHGLRPRPRVAGDLARDRAVLKDQAGAIVVAAGHVRLRKALVVSQVAISLLMLIGAALFTRSLRNLNARRSRVRREAG